MWILIIFLVAYIVYERLIKNRKIENSLDKEEMSKNEVDMSNPPFQMAYSVLTKAELEFYNALKHIIDMQNEKICPKVRMIDVLWVKTYVKNKQSFLNKVTRKHFDFVVCDINTLKPLYAIELDDKTHEIEERKERDEFVDKLFEKLNFKVIHIKWQSQYDIEKLRMRLNEELKKESLSNKSES